MDLSSLESKVLDAPAKAKRFSLPKVDVPDIKAPDVKVAIPDVKIPEVSVTVPDVSLPSVELPSVDPVSGPGEMLTLGEVTFL